MLRQTYFLLIVLLCTPGLTTADVMSPLDAGIDLSSGSAEPRQRVSDSQVNPKPASTSVQTNNRALNPVALSPLGFSDNTRVRPASLSLIVIGISMFVVLMRRVPIAAPIQPAAKPEKNRSTLELRPTTEWTNDGYPISVRVRIDYSWGSTEPSRRFVAGSLTWYIRQAMQGLALADVIDDTSEVSQQAQDLAESEFRTYGITIERVAIVVRTLRKQLDGFRSSDISDSAFRTLNETMSSSSSFSDSQLVKGDWRELVGASR